MVVRSSLGEPKLNFIFANFSFAFEYEELKETRDEWTTEAEKQSIMHP